MPIQVTAMAKISNSPDPVQRCLVGLGISSTIRTPQMQLTELYQLQLIKSIDADLADHAFSESTTHSFKILSKSCADQHTLKIAQSLYKQILEKPLWKIIQLAIGSLRVQMKVPQT